MSKRTFFRRFKAEFGMTAYQWMLKQTCNTIISELAKQEAVPKDVAEKLDSIRRAIFVISVNGIWASRQRNLSENAAAEKSSRKIPVAKC